MAHVYPRSPSSSTSAAKNIIKKPKKKKEENSEYYRGLHNITGYIVIRGFLVVI